MTKIKLILGLTFGILLLSTSCNLSYQKVLKSADMDAKYDKAKEYYNEGDCFKALALFEEIITYYKGSRDLEEIYYSYANCQLAQQEYILAAYHFDRFNQLYPRSEKVEDATFMIAKCNHEQSPKYNLDQTPTYQAIKQYQRFVEKYPTSEKVTEANMAIDQLRDKLHQKALEGAKLYFKLKDYQAAATTYKNLIQEFPESKVIEESYYYVVLADKLFADNSYDSKKIERYETTIDDYTLFKKKFPGSKYIKELDEIYNESFAFINGQTIKDEQKKQRRS